MPINAIFWISIAVAALVGVLLGFGRSLKWFTKGIFGIIIAVVVCIMIGGTVMKWPFVQKFIEDVNIWFGERWAFLARIHLGTIIFYLTLGGVVQLARIIIVKIIVGITKSKNKAIRVFNRIGGVLFMAAFIFGLWCVALAVLTDVSADVPFDGTLAWLLENNPITFGVWVAPPMPG